MERRMERMEICNTRRVEHHHSLCRLCWLILILTALSGLCIPTCAGDDADHWIKEGYKLKWKGLFDQAIESFERALEIYNQEIAVNPGDFNATGNKSLLLAKLNRTDEAIQTLNRAVEADPENPAAWKMKGFALISIAKIREREVEETEFEDAGQDSIYNQSQQAFDRALGLDPDDA
jgi:tetratricopeptide (TPR) repeat protein